MSWWLLGGNSLTKSTDIYADLLLTGLLGTHFYEIRLKLDSKLNDFIQGNTFENAGYKMSTIYSDLNMLNI